MIRNILIGSGLSGALILLGCATPVQSGQSIAAVESARGKPSATYALPDGGQRLAYAATFGQQTLMVDVNSQGKVVRSYNALTDQNFGKIQIGTFDRQDVAREFGPPAGIGLVGWGDHTFEVWSYRYKQADTANSLMHVHFGADGKVAKYYPGIDPRFDPPNARD